MKFDFEAFGESQISRELLRIGQYAGDGRPLWFSLARKIVSWNKKQFETGGRRASGGWAPLKPATVAFKKRHGLDPRILVATGALMDSLSSVRAKGQTFISDESQMVLRSNIEYGVHHQHGAPAAKLPRRRVIEFRDTDRKEIVRDIQRYVLTGKIA